MAELIRADGGARLVLVGPRALLGSDPAGALVLPGLEPEHALCARVCGEGWTLTALAAGARLAGAELAVGETRPLASGAALDLGGVSLTFADDPPGAWLPPAEALVAALAAAGAERACVALEVVTVARALAEGRLEAAREAEREAALEVTRGLPRGALLAGEGSGRLLVALAGDGAALARRLRERLATLPRAGGQPALEAWAGVGAGRGAEGVARARAALARARARGEALVVDDGRVAPATPALAGAPESLRLLRIAELLLLEPLEAEPFLELLLTLLVAHTRAERGAVYLTSGGEPRLVASRIPSGLLRSDAFQVSRSLIRDCARGGASILVADALSDPRLRERGSVVEARLRSVLVAPIGALGVVYLDSDRLIGAFSPQDQELVSGLARLLAGPLQLALDGEARGLAPSARPAGFEALVGEHPAWLRALALAARYAQAGPPLVIVGESGTGKELLARAVHARGRGGPLVVLDCAAADDALREDLLFGHEAGAFSGAAGARPGLFEQADGGALLLDGIDEAPPELQGALLRALESGEVRRLGGDEPRRVDVRVLGTSARPLRELVEQGTLREDLYYRLNVLEVALPPLRERREDVERLAQAFLARHGGPGWSLSPAALELLRAQPWPGNARELENALRAALAGAGPRPRALAPGDLPAGQRGAGEPAATWQSLAEAVEALERRLIGEALRATHGNQAQAARRLGLSKSGLHRKLARLGIEVGFEVGQLEAEERGAGA
ncbi:MAG: sigma 54-interacting transcriptional regulator [Planctomycetota bacterium]